jgi:hypothetical protein
VTACPISPQILASVAAAVRGFIKGGGLKRLLEAVTPASHPPFAKQHRVPVRSMETASHR